ncbi:MAG: hypothetical protein V3S69_00340, partial [Dehalococcoidales bacterium]
GSATVHQSIDLAGHAASTTVHHAEFDISAHAGSESVHYDHAAHAGSESVHHAKTASLPLSSITGQGNLDLDYTDDMLADGSTPMTGSLVVIDSSVIDFSTEVANPGNQYVEGIAWSPTLGLWVAVGDDTDPGAYIITSPDGVNWTSQSNPDENPSYLKGVAWGDGMFIAVGGATGTDSDGYIVTSYNGTVWTERAATADITLDAVVYSPALDLWVAVGVGSYIITSSDGITWSLQTPPNNETLLGVTWSPELALFVAVGDDGQEADALIYTSSNGTSWTERANTENNHQLEDVAWGNGVFVAVGGSSTAVYVTTSVDGITWVDRSAGLPVTNDILYAVGFDGSFFAVGGDDELAYAYITSSPDGITWALHANPKDNLYLYDVAGNGDLIIATGDADGVTDSYIVSSPSSNVITIDYATGMIDGVNLSDHAASDSYHHSATIAGDLEITNISATGGTVDYIIASDGSGGLVWTVDATGGAPIAGTNVSVSGNTISMVAELGDAYITDIENLSGTLGTNQAHADFARDSELHVATVSGDITHNSTIGGTTTDAHHVVFGGNFSNLAGSITDAQLINLENISNGGTTASWVLATDGAGDSYWKADATGGGGANLFDEFIADGGTNPTAGDTNDELSILGGTGISTTGDSGADSITVNWAAASTDLSDTAALLYETELDDFSEIQAQISDEVLLKAGTLTDTYICVYDETGTDIVCNTDPAGLGGTPRLDEVTNPNTNKSFTMTSNKLKFIWTTPTPTDGAFELEVTGVFSGDLAHFHQHTGNPGATDLLHLEATDPDVTGLRITVEGTSPAIDTNGPIVTTSTVDGIDIGTDVAANTTHKGSDGSDHSLSHTQGSDTALGAMGEDIDMNTLYQLTSLAAPVGLGEAVRTTTNVTETNLNTLTGSGDTTLHDHDGISENSSARHTQGSDTALGAMGEDIDMNTLYQLTSLAAPVGAGEAVRTTAAITEAALIDVTDGGDTTEHDHDGISENSGARHTAGSDTTLGTMTADIEMNDLYQVISLQAPAALGEAIRQTANVTETNLNTLTGSGDTTLHDHDGISENSTHRGSDGSDHSLSHAESHDNTYHSTNYEVEDAFLTDIASLTDPAGDRGLGWDDTDNDIRFFTWGSNIAYDQAT